MDNDDGRSGGAGWTRPDLHKHQDEARTGRGDLVRPRPVDIVPTQVYAPVEPPRPPRNRLLPVVIALAVVLVLVVGILVGVFLTSGRSSGGDDDPVASPTTTAAPRSTTPAAPTTPQRPTESVGPTTGAAATGTGVPVVPVGPPTEQQLRVTDSGQDLDRLIDTGDRIEDVAFFSSSNEFRTYRGTAKWTGAAAPSAADCVREIHLQPLSDNERYGLRNSPLVSVCAYTSLGNLVHLQALGNSEGDGVQVKVTIWQAS